MNDKEAQTMIDNKNGMVQVCCEYLYETYILQGVPENKWPDLHQRVAKQVGFDEWMNLKMEREKKEIEKESK